MSERTIDEFKAAIQYCPDEEAEIDKYLTLKGPDRYFEVLDTYRKESKKSKPSWQEVSSFYRYDKRICFLFFRYFSMFEEYLRALLLREPIHLKPEDYPENERGKYYIFIKKMTVALKHSKSGLPYERLELSYFSTLVDLYLLLPSSATHSWTGALSSNRATFVDLRNRVMHGRFLFGASYGGKTLKEAVKLFGTSLPKAFAFGEDEHPGFFAELRKTGGDFEDFGSLLLDPRLGDVDSFSPLRSVTMFNAGFGDCFLIKDGFANLVVDCGTLNAMYPSRSVLTRRLRSMLIDSPELLITHFHADHVNGIGSIVSPTRKFKIVYVRGMSKTGLFGFFASSICKNRR